MEAIGFGDWLISGRHGVSSLAIAGRLTGASIKDDGFQNHPSDPADFRRCILLLKAVPEWRGRIREMGVVSDVWERLVLKWDELEDLLELEMGEYSIGAPRTYARMKEIIGDE